MNGGFLFGAARTTAERMAAGGKCERASATATIKKAKTTNRATTDRGAESIRTAGPIRTAKPVGTAGPIRRTATDDIEMPVFGWAAGVRCEKLETRTAAGFSNDAGNGAADAAGELLLF